MSTWLVKTAENGAHPNASVETLLSVGPIPLKVYKRATWVDKLTREQMNMNSVLGLVRSVPKYGDRLRGVLEAYAKLLPPPSDEEVQLGDVTVRRFDRFAPVRACMEQWYMFATLCIISEKQPLSPAKAPCSALACALSSSLGRECKASIDEYEEWLLTLEASASNEISLQYAVSRAAVAQKRPGQPPPADEVGEDRGVGGGVVLPPPAKRVRIREQDDSSTHSDTD